MSASGSASTFAFHNYPVAPGTTAATPVPPSPQPPPAVTPHILPCCINHDGPIADAARYWRPRIDGDDDGAGGGGKQQQQQQKRKEGIETERGTETETEMEMEMDTETDLETVRADATEAAAEATATGATSGDTVTPGSTATAYFRGRRLRGRRVPLPAGYHGTYMQTDKQNVFI